MSDSRVNSERRKQLDEIMQVCTEIESAVQSADWDVAGTLLSRRHQLLAAVFAEPPVNTAEVAALTEVAEQVMAFDADLIPLADAAKGETAQELKKLRQGRAATNVYKQVSN